MDTFITIDFEVASRYEYSPCSVSVCEFKNNNCTQLLSTFINPGDVYFDPFLTELHGITKDMVVHAPTVENVMKDICKIIENKFVFAHNASYDISKLITGCNLYDINIPYFEYADSLMIAKRTWNGLVNYKLDTISEFLNIELNHHKATSDAIACGKIILAALEKYDVNKIDDLLEKVKYQKGYYDGSLSRAFSKKLYSSNSNSNRSTSDYKKIRNLVINTNVITNFSGKYIVFTGALKIKRSEAMKIVADEGGIPEGNVTKNTNYLVVGRDDYGNFKAGNKSNKMLKAEQLIAKGQDLEIITEDDFLDMIS